MTEGGYQGVHLQRPVFRRNDLVSFERLDLSLDSTAVRPSWARRRRVFDMRSQMTWHRGPPSQDSAHLERFDRRMVDLTG